MADISFSSTLYDCATECALRRQKGKCKEQFKGVACEYCKLDIRKYIDADPRHVDLFMLQAETRALHLRRASRPVSVRAIVALIVLGIFGFILFNAERERAIRWNLNSPLNTLEQPTKKTEPVNYGSVHEQTVYALNHVTQDMKNRKDVNGDQKVNCIDAAVRFYYHFKNKEVVCIIVNYNEKTGMHHLFNAVLLDGVWRAVEPQAYYKNHASYFMRDVWGNIYDSSLNKDVTVEYKKYAK